MNPTLIETAIWGLNLEIRLLGLVILILSLTAIYPPYIWSMVKGEQTPPRSTWFLWLALDFVALGSRMAAGNLDTLLLAYTIGTFFVALFTVKYGTKGWTTLETISTISVALSIIIWLVIGSSVATACAMSGITIAMLPMLKRVFQGAYENLMTWSIAIVTSTLNLADGQILTSVWMIIIQLSVLLPVLYYYKYLPWKHRHANTL